MCSILCMGTRIALKINYVLLMVLGFVSAMVAAAMYVKAVPALNLLAGGSSIGFGIAAATLFGTGAIGWQSTKIVEGSRAWLKYIAALLVLAILSGLIAFGIYSIVAADSEASVMNQETLVTGLTHIWTNFTASEKDEVGAALGCCATVDPVIVGPPTRLGRTEHGSCQEPAWRDSNYNNTNWGAGCSLNPICYNEGECVSAGGAEDKSCADKDKTACLTAQGTCTWESCTRLTFAAFKPHSPCKSHDSLAEDCSCTWEEYTEDGSCLKTKSSTPFELCNTRDIVESITKKRDNPKTKEQCELEGCHWAEPEITNLCLPNGPMETDANNFLAAVARIAADFTNFTTNGSMETIMAECTARIAYENIRYGGENTVLAQHACMSPGGNTYVNKSDYSITKPRTQFNDLPPEKQRLFELKVDNKCVFHPADYLKHKNCGIYEHTMMPFCRANPEHNSYVQMVKHQWYPTSLLSVLLEGASKLAEFIGKESGITEMIEDVAAQAQGVMAAMNLPFADWINPANIYSAVPHCHAKDPADTDECADRIKARCVSSSARALLQTTQQAQAETVVDCNARVKPTCLSNDNQVTLDSECAARLDVDPTTSTDPLVACYGLEGDDSKCAYVGLRLIASACVLDDNECRFESGVTGDTAKTRCEEETGKCIFIPASKLEEEPKCVVEDADTLKLAFVVDSSGSIGFWNWPTVKEFMITMTTLLSGIYGEDNAQFGVVLFSSSSETIFPIEKRPLNVTLEHIQNLGFIGGGTSTKDGVMDGIGLFAGRNEKGESCSIDGVDMPIPAGFTHWTKEECSKVPHSYFNHGETRSLVTLTDGAPNFGQSPCAEEVYVAEQAKAITGYAVGIGSWVSVPALKCMVQAGPANTNFMDRVFLTNSFEALKDEIYSNRIADSVACPPLAPEPLAWMEVEAAMAQCSAASVVFVRDNVWWVAIGVFGFLFLLLVTFIFAILYARSCNAGKCLGCCWSCGGIMCCCISSTLCACCRPLVNAADTVTAEMTKL